MFQQRVQAYLKENDVTSANRVIMRELAGILMRNRKDFVDLLNYSGIPAEEEMTDAELISLFIKHVPYNKRLMVGAAYLTGQHNRTMGADGDSEVNNEDVHMVYDTLSCYFTGGDFDMTDPSDEFFNAAGTFGSIVEKGAELASTIAQGQQKKKYGAQDFAIRQQEAKNQMIQAVLSQRQAEAEAKRKRAEERSKTNKVLIVGGVIAGLGILAFIFYQATKGKE